MTTYCAAATAVAGVCLVTVHASGSTHANGAVEATSVHTIATSVERKAAGLAASLGCSDFTGVGSPLARPVGAIAYSCTGSVRSHTQWDDQFLAAFNRKAKPPTGLAPTFAVIVVFTSRAARTALVRQDVAAHTLSAAMSPAAIQLATLDPASPDVVGPDWLVSGNDANARVAAVRLGGVLQTR